MDRNTIHHRAFAAIMLLAFAITAVVMGLFAITTTTSAIAPATIAVASVITVVAIVTSKKAPDESFIDTLLNLLVIATLLVASGLVTAFAKMTPGYRMALVDINDTGQMRGRFGRRHTWTATDDAMLRGITADGRAAQGDALIC